MFSDAICKKSASITRVRRLRYQCSQTLQGTCGYGVPQELVQLAPDRLVHLMISRSLCFVFVHPHHRYVLMLSYLSEVKQRNRCR